MSALGALDQHQSEEKEKGDPDPDRGLNHPPDDEQKRDRRETNAQASGYVMADDRASISLRRALFLL
jgi:hypothetical protein